MNRRDAVISLLAAGVWPLAARAQQVGKIYRLGTFDLTKSPFTEPNSAFFQSLRDLGWIEGKNIVVERRSDAAPEHLSALVAELVRLNVDVIVVVSAGLAIVAHETTKTIPIVTLSAGDLEGIGLIASLARPGGNVTGMQVLNSDLMSKRVDILKQLVPTLSRLSVLEPITPAGIITPNYFRKIYDAAKTLGVRIQRVPFRAVDELVNAFETIRGNGSQAALVISNPLSLSGRKEIAELAETKRVPVMYEHRAWTVSGNGLISYGAVVPEVQRQAATFVDRLFRGARASDLPVEQPNRFELIISLRTAKAIGLKVPQSLLAQADEVIQ